MSLLDVQDADALTVGLPWHDLECRLISRTWLGPGFAAGKGGKEMHVVCHTC